MTLGSCNTVTVLKIGTMKTETIMAMKDQEDEMVTTEPQIHQVRDSRRTRAEKHTNNGCPPSTMFSHEPFELVVHPRPERSGSPARTRRSRKIAFINCPGEIPGSKVQHQVFNPVQEGL